MAVCLAIVGKENNPLYLWVGNKSDELQLQFLAHTGLDVVQEKISSCNKSTGNSLDLYLGLLYASEEYKIYGYTTNTRVKFIIVTDAGNMSLRDNEVRMMFRDLHTLYTTVVCDPFYIPGQEIKSRSFIKGIKNIMPMI